VNLKFARAVVRDLKLAANDVVGNDRPANFRAQIHLRPAFLEFAAANKDVPACRLHRRASGVAVIPIAKRAIRKPHRAAARNFGDLIARAPNEQLANLTTPDSRR